MSIDKIISRVQKFLAVSRSDNEHEAALAASKAAALMAEYSLSEAMLRVSDSSRQAETIVDGVKLVDSTRKRTAWREAISDSVAKSLGVHIYLNAENETIGFGREGAVQAWNYTCQYLFNEVDRLADEAWAREGEEAEAVGQTIRRWKNAFRVGAASTIGQRLRENAEAGKQDRVQRDGQPLRNGETYCSCGAALLDARCECPPSTRAQALTIMERDEQEVQSAYNKRIEGYRRVGSIGSISSRTGYNAGKEAGGRVALGGGRAALGAGQGRLR